ncbi:MAG: GntR family transcriptional regulator [Planctomycetota bacterium]|nr:GntR family transcriptional regulator [Planctomycetota bacterium]
MPFSHISDESSVYERLLKIVFSEDATPGEKLVERNLASELGVSRIPVRESVREMVAQGLLVGGEKWEGVRTRRYTPDDIRQLSEFREIFDGGAARIAAMNATDMDVAQLEMICTEAESEVGNYGSERWAHLDHRFHEAVADASHNQRLVHFMKFMLAESHYAFYVHPGRMRRSVPSKEEAVEHMQRVVKDHRTLVDMIREKDADGAEKIARAHIWTSGRQAAQDLIASKLV